MKEKKTSPLRERMIEDMRIRGMSPKTQQGHIRAVEYFAEFIGRSPDAGFSNSRTSISVIPGHAFR